MSCMNRYININFIDTVYEECTACIKIHTQITSSVLNKDLNRLIDLKPQNKTLQETFIESNMKSIGVRIAWDPGITR